MEIKTEDENTFFAKYDSGALHELTIIVSSYPVRFLLQACTAENEPIRVRTQRNKQQKQYSADKVFSLLLQRRVPLERVKLSSGFAPLDVTDN